MKPAIGFVPREVFSQTRNSLETLYQRTPEPFDLVCVDGHAPPEVADYLATAAREKGFTLLRSDRYLTPNQGRNLAATWIWQHTAAPWIVFVDNDVLVSPGWLTALHQCALETGAWLVAPQYFEHLPERTRLHLHGGECRILTDARGIRRYREQHHHQHQLIAEVDQPMTRRTTELVEFHTLLVRREVFQQLGPLDEGLFCHAEHGDLCLRVLAAGQSIWIEPQAQITYVPPSRLHPADRDFFFLRWSKAWFQANDRHFIRTWGLAADYDGGRSKSWLRQHRRYGLSSLAWLRRRIGKRSARIIEKRVVAPLEVLVNRYRYPRRHYGKLPQPQIEVVHSPSTCRKAA